MPSTSTSTSTLTRSPIDRHGETVATVQRYQRAQRLVDHLSDEGFPVEHAAIVGRDLRFVEHVTGRRRYGRAALEGAGSGTGIGALIGFLLGLFTLFEAQVSWLAMVISWALIGAIAGAFLGLIGQALRRGRRDFSSVGRMEAAEFDVTVRSEHADRARELLEAAR